MPTYDDELVVLRSQPLGEADRIVTCIGKESGHVRAVARGVRRTSSKIGARLEPFNVVDAQLFTRATGNNRGLETVTQAVMVHPFSARIRERYLTYAAANVIAEVADTVVPAEPAPLQYALIVAALRDLSADRHAVELTTCAYVLRSLALAGWEPTFTECARCGEPGPHPFVSVALGGAICQACAARAGALLRTDVDTLRLCWALLVGNWRVADASESPAREATVRIVAAYAAYHLERPLRSFGLFDQIRRADPESQQ